MGTGSVDQLMRKVDAEFVDAAHEKLGFLLYQAIAEESGLITTVTVFEKTEDYRRALETAGAIREALAEFNVNEVEDLSGAVMVARADAKILAPVRPSTSP
jgi:hypothetical protein